MDTKPEAGIYVQRNDPDRVMLRIKLPGGAVTPDQIDLIAEIAGEEGAVDITTRQEIQIYGVPAASVEAAIEQLTKSGLTTLGAGGPGVRNIVGCPAAGVDRQEAFDVSPTIKQLHDFFLGNSEMPKPLRISVSACADQCVHPAIQDIALVGITRTVSAQGGSASGGEEKSETGFDLWMGGNMAEPASLGRSLGVFIKPEEVLEVVRAAIDVWRLVPEALTDAVRARAELQERLGRPLESGASDAPADTFRDHVGVYLQKPGTYYVGVPVLTGRLTGKQLESIANFCRRQGDGLSIRLTTRHGVVFLNVPEASVSRLLENLAEVELSINAHPIRRGLTACVGTDTCAASVSGTTARARHIVNHIEDRLQLEALRLGVSGCAHACGQHPIAHIGLAAHIDEHHAEVYDIWLGGQLGKDARLGRVILRDVPAAECAKRLEQLLRTFREKRKPATESFNAFCDRLGDPELARLLTELPKKRDEDEDSSVAPAQESVSTP